MKYFIIEPTNKCNANCLICGNIKDKKKRNIGFMNLELMKLISGRIKNYKNEAVKIVFAGVGEPFLHPQFFEFLELVKKNNKVEVGIYTNGHILTPEIIDKLVDLNDGYMKLEINLSIHSFNPSTYKKIMNLNLEDCIDNIKYLFTKNKDLDIKLRIVKCKLNENEVDKMLANFNKQGNFARMELVDNRGGCLNNLEIYDDDFYQRNSRKTDNQNYICQDFLFKDNIMIRWNGFIDLCCTAHNEKHYLGNIKDLTINQIINNIENFTKSEEFKEICLKCNRNIAVG